MLERTWIEFTFDRRSAVARLCGRRIRRVVIKRVRGIVAVELDVVVVEINRMVLIAEVSVAVHFWRIVVLLETHTKTQNRPVSLSESWPCSN